jgi:hypothetical protein
VRARAELDNARAFLEYFDGSVGASLASLDRAVAGFEATKALERFRRVIGAKAYVLRMLGRRRESSILRQGILAVATVEGDLRSMSASMIDLGIGADELRDGLDLNLEAAAIARRGGYGQIEMTAMANAVEAAVETGAWQTADELLADLGERAELPAGVEDIITLGGALLAAYRGDADAAKTAIDGLTPQTTQGDPTLRAWYHRALSLLAMMAGDVDQAYADGMSAVEVEPEGPNRAFAVWAAGQAAVWLGDAAKARAPLERTEPDDVTWELATRRAIEAGIAALEGHPQEAAAAFVGVLADRLARGDRFTHALVTVGAVEVLPPELIPQEAVETARAYLEDLGAAPLLARLTPSAEPATAER